ncbi:aminotransferase class I/II-fold pyridoxal phosphate-dependent enzyme [Streptomyces sp. 061-3]|uniref:aminotransferase class I/II-fold pyridoxal phosphate-dependent enzyme n=1 Tax=Streptomyces sp. 061-3 TaxID=2789268 RepID=UPI00397EF4C2
MTIGSMSKTHWGGLRIGWLRAPSRLVTELAGQRIATDMGGSVLDQLLALALLARAGELLPPRLQQMREQRAALAAALAEHIPQWTWQLPPGGLSLWVDLGEPIASPLAERALDYGVRIEGGAYFATDPGILEQRLRIPYTTPPDTLREAVRRMATVLADGLPPSSATRRPHWVA